MSSRSPAIPGPMRIAILTESFLPYLSGVTVATDALARGLGAAGHEVLVVAPRPANGEEPPAVGSPGPSPRYAWLPSYQLPGVAPPGYRMPWAVPSAALRAAVAFAPEVVHTQSPFVAGIMARRLARRLHIPLVFTHHTRFTDYRHYLGPFAGPGARLMEAYLRRFWDGCDAVVVPSAELATEMAAEMERVHAAHSDRPRIRVIATGIDRAGIGGLAPADPRAEPGWPDDTIVAVSVGRLAPEKSPDLLLDAFAVAVLREPRLRLVLIGGGPSTASLRQRVARPPLAGAVHLTGPLPRLATLALVRGADLFVFASRTETQGLVLAEALAAGAPVVAVAGPAIAASVRDGTDGIIVAAAPAADLATRLGETFADLAADTARRARLAAAATSGAERFELRGRVAEMVELYRELAAMRRHSPPPRRRCEVP